MSSDALETSRDSLRHFGLGYFVHFLLFMGCSCWPVSSDLWDSGSGVVHIICIPKNYVQFMDILILTLYYLLILFLLTPRTFGKLFLWDPNPYQ